MHKFKIENQIYFYISFLVTDRTKDQNLIDTNVWKTWQDFESYMSKIYTQQL
jgi:hypothetical protein